MVSRSSGRAKKLPAGTKVSFTQDVTDGDIQKGDVGTLRVERQTLPRGRGVISTYFVDFDDDTSIEVEGDTTFWIAEEAPSVAEQRRELHAKVSRVSRRVGGGLRRIGQVIGTASIAAGASAGKAAGAQAGRMSRELAEAERASRARARRERRPSTRAAPPSAPSPDHKKDPWYGTGEYQSPLEGSPGRAEPPTETRAESPTETRQWKSPLEETHRIPIDGLTDEPEKKDDPWYKTKYRDPLA